MALLPPPAAAETRPLALTRAGRFFGQRKRSAPGSDDYVESFLGIRYGQAERFRAPLAEPPSTGPVDASRFGPVCPQRSVYGPQSEDCLYLNVWTRSADPQRRRPVMVYFHGGAYSTGSVTDPLNDGHQLALSQDVVVVTVNHRLNTFGYLYLARLDPRFPDSGNLGQLDLILALKWVRDNISAFGGDPDRVMVFGQSGGGAKIATLMAMPGAKDLFHRAATMSGQQVTASGPLNATKRAEAYLAKLGVSPGNLQPLLDMPHERLVEGLSAVDPILGGSVYMGPVLDMRSLPRHPFWPDAPTQSAAIPMILGNTRDETRAFIDPRGPKLQGLDWTNIAARIAPEIKIDLSPEWIVAQYRNQFPDWSAERIFFAATTAGRSWPGQVIEADARAADTGSPTWVYQLDFQSPVEPWRGAPHTLDIPLVFGTLDAKGSITGTGEGARRVSAAMMKAFASLAATGDPKWPRYALPDRQTMVFDTQSRAVADPRRFERELFARAPYIQPGS